MRARHSHSRSIFATMRSAIFLPSLTAALLVACKGSRSSTAQTSPPRAEFLVSGGDSTYWVASGPTGIRVRGSPILLARFGGHFHEVFVADDDRSYPNAFLVGERLYRRDIMTGDSALVFADSLVPRLAAAYARAHPHERPLGPNEDGNDDPPTSVTAEVDVLELFGPYVSYEYHADVA